MFSVLQVIDYAETVVLVSGGGMFVGTTLLFLLLLSKISRTTQLISSWSPLKSPHASTPSNLLPLQRKFLPLNITNHEKDKEDNEAVLASIKLRVLQFNMLADGLSGLRADLGGFAGVSRERGEMEWSRRKELLLHELLQYDADILTLQEVDHFYDWLQPAMAERGYTAFFAAKPASPCLEVSSNADGCALFVRSSKIQCRSVQTLTYAVKSDGKEEDEEGEGGVAGVGAKTGRESTVPLRTQNQVAIIALCEILLPPDSSTSKPALLLVATTHLKASKSLTGERCRAMEMRQLLETVARTRNAISASENGANIAVLLTGDLNAKPEDSSDYPALAYSATKSFTPLTMRSIYNDDAPLYLQSHGEKSALQEEGLYTTWKARVEAGSGIRKESRHCIDYIFYSSEEKKKKKEYRDRTTVETRLRPTALLDVFSKQEVGSSLLPSALYPSDHLAIVADFLFEVA